MKFIMIEHEGDYDIYQMALYCIWNWPSGNGEIMLPEVRKFAQYVFESPEKDAKTAVEMALDACGGREERFVELTYMLEKKYG